MTGPAERRDGLRVLVVDDNADAADTLCALLRFWGHDAEAAYDGAAGLERATATAPDCLFLDIDLPRLDGYQLARRLRAQPALSRSKLIALTAAGNRRLTAEAGFDYHLTKPADLYDVEALLNMLTEVIKVATQTQKLAEQSAALAQETKGLITEAREEVKELKGEIREVKGELREVKAELREVKEAIGKDREQQGGA